MKVKLVSLAIAVSLFAAGSALASTVNDTISFVGGTTTGSSIKTYVEDGYQFYDARIVGGPCEVSGSDKCAALNPHETTVLTRVDGRAFSLSSIWFYLNGKSKDGSNALAIFDTNNTSHRFDLTQPTYDHNTGYTVAMNFVDVFSITFESGGTNDKGNARFDTLKVSTVIPPVPLPAAGFLLFGALGGLAVMRRRKMA